MIENSLLACGKNLRPKPMLINTRYNIPKKNPDNKSGIIKANKPNAKHKSMNSLV